MRVTRRLRLIVAACCLTGGGPMGFFAWAGATPTDASLNACEQAGAAAEQASGIPAGLLLAIGRIESGRWDNERGRAAPWPWAINAAGKGQWFDTKEGATLTTRALLNGGARSIDTGCFQISLLYHPTAFASLEQAFDPDANARYAARFLVSLFAREGSWEAAVQAYHSADPALGFAYRQQVFSSWLAAAPVTLAAAVPVRIGTVPMLTAALATKPEPMPAVFAGVQVWSPLPPGTGARTVAMPPPAGDASEAAARALPVVSYRIMPVR
jgi:hypothetical protein